MPNFKRVWVPSVRSDREKGVDAAIFLISSSFSAASCSLPSMTLKLVR